MPKFLYISTYNYNSNPGSHTRWCSSTLCLRSGYGRYGNSLLIDLSILPDDDFYTNCLINSGYQGWEGNTIMLLKNNNIIKWYSNNNERLQLNSKPDIESSLELYKYSYLAIG